MGPARGESLEPPSSFATILMLLGAASLEKSDADEKLGDEEIDDQDEHGRNHHGLRGRATDTLGAASGV